MKYAVVRSGGKQYKVSEGDIVEVDRLKVEAGASYAFPEVLLSVTDGKVVVGTPHLSGVVVKGKVLEQKKAKKVRVATFKAKARVRKVRGFRALITRVQIESIK